MRLRRLTAAACLLPLLSAALVACSEEGDEIAPGDVLTAVHADRIDRSAARLLVPTGEIQVEAGEPRERLKADQTRDRAAYDAPKGSTFVPITWRFDTRRFGTIERFLATTATPVVDLTSGKKSYRLPPPTPTGGAATFYMLIDGDGEDLTLEVGFDGVTQSVDLRSGKRDAGRARGLYRLPAKPRPRRTSCDEGTRFTMPQTKFNYSCELVGPMLLPYAAGAWAEEGHRLLVMDVRTSLKRAAQAGPGGAGEAGAWWFGDRVRIAARADTRKPLAVIRSGGKDDDCPEATTTECRWAAVVVVDVAGKRLPRRLQLDASYRLALGPTWGDFNPPPHRAVPAKGSVRLRVR